MLASVLPESYLPHAAPSPCTLWFRSPSCWESSLPVGIPMRDSLFGEFCWFWWQHCCPPWLLLLCSTLGWGGGADQEELALTWLCCAVLCWILHPGASGAMWDHPPGLGAGGESGQLPGIVCRVWEQMCCSTGISAHTAVGGYAVSGAIPLLLPLSRGEAVCAPRFLPVEVGAGHLFSFVFERYQVSNSALCVQNIKLQLVLVCQRC